MSWLSAAKIILAALLRPFTAHRELHFTPLQNFKAVKVEELKASTSLQERLKKNRLEGCG